ncbi:MAG TPA: glycosyltransferase [Bryobacteraceae bacterium]
MKIAFVLGPFPMLSMTFVLDQITGMIDRGHSVAIFAEFRPDEPEVHADVTRYGLEKLVRYERLPDSRFERLWKLPRIWRPTTPMLRALDVVHYRMLAPSLRLVWAAAPFAGRGDFDIVQCHFGALGVKAVLLRRMRALRGKIVTAFHGDDITMYPHLFRGNVYAPLFADGDLFLPISARWNDKLLRMGCPADRIRVHRMGVDLRRFAPRNSTLSAGPLRILTVARLVEKKGVAHGIRAAARLRTPFDYTIVGDGPLRAELEALVQKLGIADRVRFAGARDRAYVADVMGHADILLAPSVSAVNGDIEGMPVAIMEAMACALPVVATRHSGIPELIADGVSGLLADEHDAEALAAALERLAADPSIRKRMGNAGREIIARDFEIGALNDRLEAIYRELLSSDVRQ